VQRYGPFIWSFASEPFSLECFVVVHAHFLVRATFLLVAVQQSFLGLFLCPALPSFAVGRSRALCIVQVRQRHRLGTVVTPYHIREAGEYFGLAEEDVRECVQELGGTVWEEDDDQVKGRPLPRCWLWFGACLALFVCRVEVVMQWCYCGMSNLRGSGTLLTVLLFSMYMRPSIGTDKEEVLRFKCRKEQHKFTNDPKY